MDGELEYQLGDPEDHINLSNNKIPKKAKIIIGILIILLIIFIILFIISILIIYKYENEKNKIKNDKDILEKEMNSLKTEIDNLKIENTNLKTENNNLKIENNNLIKDNDNLKNEKNNIITEKKNLEAENDNLKIENNNLIKDNDDLKNENDNIIIQKNNLITENNNLKNENDNLSNENNNLKIQNQNLQKNSGFNFELFGEKLSNLPYAKNNIIKNSFKEGDITVLKNINNGNDYNANERNFYDLYIPYPATKRKKEFNRIMLFIHGGAWIQGDKESLDIFCRTYTSQGFITATMGYTLLNGAYDEYNIYRIIDEITAVIQSIKDKLIEKGFEGEKLELAIGGGSAGGHLSLLYAYGYAKRSPIPIKFVINLCAPIGLEEEYFLRLKDYNNENTLENIDYDSIEKAKIENKVIIPKESGDLLVALINVFLGRTYDEDLFELFDYKNMEIIKESEIYKELFSLVSYSFPINFIDANTLPTICVYGGKDDIVGVSAYSYLKKKFDDCKNNNIVLVYSRYAPHNPISFDTQNGIDAAREMNFQILNFSEIYFTSNQDT